MSGNGEKIALGEMKSKIEDLKEEIMELKQSVSSIKGRVVLLVLLQVINVVLNGVLLFALLANLGAHAASGHLAQQGVVQGAQIVSVHENGGPPVGTATG